MTVFQSAVGFTAFSSFVYFSQSMFFGACITSLEKNFGLSSRQAGLIPSMYDISCIVCGLVVGYFGIRTHRPRAIGTGGFILSFAAFLFVIPKAIVGKYDYNWDSSSSTARLCELGYERGFCPPTNANDASYALFLVSVFLAGIGGTLVYVLTGAFLSDNTAKKAYPLHMSFILAMILLGTAVGFLLGGGVFIAMFVDLHDPLSKEKVVIKPDNPAWVGAWWLQFILVGGLLAIASIPLLCFPKQIKQEKEEVKGIRIEAANDGKLKDIGVRLKRLVLNPVLMFLLMGSLISTVSLGGAGTFLPKIMEVQFHMTTDRATLVAGAILVPGAVLGALTGGAFARITKLSGRGSMLTLVFITLIAGACTSGFLLSCPSPPVVGTTLTAYNDTNPMKGNLSSACNSHCLCHDDLYRPVCGSDGFTYFSVCHAGCKNVVADANQETVNGRVFQAQSDRCEPENCSYLGPFIFLFFSAVFVIYSGGPLVSNALVRCVEKEDKSLSLGMYHFALHIGLAVGPLLLGFVIDATCSLWNDSCSDRGNCWVYDNKRLGYNIFYLSVVGAVLCGICFFISWWTFKNEIDPEEDDDDDDDDDDNDKTNKPDSATEEEEIKMKEVPKAATEKETPV